MGFSEAHFISSVLKKPMKEREKKFSWEDGPYKMALCFRAVLFLETRQKMTDEERRIWVQ